MKRKPVKIRWTKPALRERPYAGLFDAYGTALDEEQKQAFFSVNWGCYAELLILAPNPREGCELWQIGDWLSLVRESLEGLNPPVRDWDWAWTLHPDEGHPHVHLLLFRPFPLSEGDLEDIRKRAAEVERRIGGMYRGEFEILPY